MDLTTITWLTTLKTTNKPIVDDCIVHIGNIFPLIKEYKNTIQDPIWHAEGDVHIHTDMVLTELYKLLESKEWKKYNQPNFRRILILAALLHDYGKPSTTFTCKDTGRIKASKHEEVGRNLLVLPLLELDLPQHEYLQILNLVGLHQRPKLLVIKDEPMYKYLALNENFFIDLMYILELADLRGRTCIDKEESIMYLEEWYKKAKEYCKDQTDQLVNINSMINTAMHKVGRDDLATGLDNYSFHVGIYQYHNNLIPTLYDAMEKYKGYINPHFNVVLTCGLSATGKSTYIKQHYPDYHIISMDVIREELCNGNRSDQSKNKEVAVIAKERFKECLRKKQNVVWDATNLRKEYREQLITLSHNYNALTHLIVFLDKEKNIKKKDKERKWSVSDSIIDKQIKSWQFPFFNETHIVKYIHMYKENKN